MQLPIAISIHRANLLARLLCRGDIVSLTLGADGRLVIGRRNGLLADADVLPETTVFPSLIVMRLHVAEGVESLVLPVSATGSDAHRRMRVWLKWRAKIAASALV